MSYFKAKVHKTPYLDLMGPTSMGKEGRKGKRKGGMERPKESGKGRGSGGGIYKAWPDL